MSKIPLKRVSIAKDFTVYPGPRYIRQGQYSGEKFRRQLVKWLEEAECVEIDLDGTTGMGSSFLDEAFGGLIRKEGFDENEIRRRVRVKSVLDESYLEDFEDSIRRAKPKA